jgi:hypothetical protein
MRCLRITILGLVTAMLVLVFAGSAFAAPAGWTVSQVSSMTGGVYAYSVAVSGDRVVWVQQVPGGNVWMWRPTEPARQISQDPDIGSEPVISGDRVAWLGYDAAQAMRVVRTWTPSSGVTTVAACPTVSSNMGPAISGHHIVWSTQISPSPALQVYEWTPPSTVATVSASSDWVHDPRVGGTRVAWYESSGGHSQVYTRASGDPAPKQLTDHVVGWAYQPDCSQERVVWVDEDEVSGDWFVRTWRASDDTSQTLGRCVSSIRPKVAGDRVAWCGLDDAGKTQVVTWKNGVTTTITAGDFARSESVVRGDRVVWLEDTGPAVRVFTWKAGDTTVTALSSEGRAAGPPQVWNDRVAWAERWNGVNQVFTAFPGEEQPTPIATTLSKPAVSPSKPKHGKYATFSAYLTPGGAGVAGAKGTLQLYHQETKTVRKKVGGKWRKVKVKYWKLRKTVTLSGASATGDNWKLSSRVKLAYKGAWRATVTATAAGNYLVPASKTLAFTAK